jgi:predicted ATP-grasp superfamily ATP-dependent carboligase
VLIPDADVPLPVARCLAVRKRAIIHGLSRCPNPKLKHSRFFASAEECKGDLDVGAWLNRVGDIVAERCIDIVLPISDFGIRTLSEHRQELRWAARLPDLPQPSIFDLATDKAMLTDFLKRHDIPRPPTIVVTGALSSKLNISALTFPVLVKPPDSSGGVGIRRFDDPASLTNFLAKDPIGARWVVQDFIEGRDLSVNVLCRNGRILAATVQHAIKVSSRSFQPAVGVEFNDNPSALCIAEKLVGQLGWSGVANIDMRYDVGRGGPVVLELNGRYWRSVLGSLNAGVNFPLLACEVALGELASSPRPRRARYFLGRRSALLSLVGGGSFRIRPHETNLRYLDPLPSAIMLASGAIRSAERSFARVPTIISRAFGVNRRAP